MLLYCAYTLSLLLLIASHVRAQTAEDQITSHFRAGQQAAADQQYPTAIAEFQAVLRLDSSLTEARANLGLMYFSTARYGDAITELKKVTAAEPELLTGQLFLGLSYLNSGMAERAIVPLEHAIQIDPANSEAARALLTCYLNTGATERATSAIARIEAQPISEDNLYAIAQGYLGLGRSYTQQLARNFASSPWAHRLAGDLAAERADWAAAASSYRQALSLDPHMTGLEAVLSQTEHPSTVTSAGNPPIDPATGCQGGQELLACEKRVQARAEAETLYRLVRATTALGNLAFEKLQRQFADSARTHQLQGEIARLRQDFPTALAEFQIAATKRPEDAELDRSVAEMDLLTDHVHEAEIALEKSLALQPGNAAAEYLLAQVALKRKDTQTAVSYLKKALASDPGLLEVRALLGTAYMHIDQPALAIPQLETALAIDYHGDLNFQLYRAYRAAGKPAAAEKALARSKELRKRSLESAVSKISGESVTELKSSGDTSQ
jgi:tetratricopeptide (TPR) repeat protein